MKCPGILIRTAALSLALGLSCSMGAHATEVAVANDVDARQGAMQERLRDYLESGRLTDAKLHEFKQSLQKIADQEALMKSKNGELSSMQGVQLRTQIEKLEKDLEAAINERSGQPVDVEAKRGQLAIRMSESLHAKKLTNEEYERYQQDLASIDKQIAAAKAVDGKMNTNDQVRINLELDNLSQRVSAGENQGSSDMALIDKRRDELRAMIRDGVARGKLTEDEVDDLRQQLYNFEAKEDRIAKMGRPITKDEELTMVLELERFGAEVRARMDNGVDIKITAHTIDVRKRALDQTFANAVFGGELTLAEAKEFKEDLEQVTATQKDLRAQNKGELTAQQIQEILITVEKLKGKYSRLTYNRTKIWPGVDGLVTSIRQKIGDATVSQRLTQEESDALQSKIADVLVAKSNERNSQGLNTTDAALKLADELALLDSEVTREINGKKKAGK